MIWAVGLVIVGLGFVLAEVFFPSLGLFSIIAIACIITADIIAFRVSSGVGYGFIGAELVLVPFVIWAGFKVLPHTPFGRDMLLEGPTTEMTPGAPDLSHLVGSPGTALTDLRPSGTARFGDERVSVVSLGGMLDAGTPLMVVSVEGTEVRVRSAAASNEQGRVAF